MLKQPLSRYILPDDQKIYYLHRKQLFETGEPQTCDLRMLKKGGTQFWAHLAATAALDIDSVPVCRVVITDSTEIRRAEEKQEQLQVRLSQAQKMEAIGSLAGGIAHDLNNILFPISGLSEMLLDEIPPGTPEYESIEQIYKSAQRGRTYRNSQCIPG